MVPKPQPSGDPLHPVADCGVLFVHGIGNHTESDTLLTFGEPMIYWLKSWLAGAKQRGVAEEEGYVRVVEARLRASRTDAVSPAYALIGIQAPKFANGLEPTTTTCLLAEAWWRDTVQIPDSLKLLGWLWYRGPLLIFAHFCMPGPDGGRGFPRILMATGLAMVVQTLVSLAIVVWMIPFDWLRQGIAGLVRALTLTLGDSFVLLEQDFQHAALLKRVCDVLYWLEQRTEHIVVVAHSQGAAIAHELLSSREEGGGKIRSFVGVGSGLEKLYFLRAVRSERTALMAAAAIAPVACALLVFLWRSFGLDASGWKAGAISAFICFVFLAGYTTSALKNYRRTLVEELNAKKPGQGRWTEMHATSDPVPMSKNSLLGDPLCKRLVVVNLRSFLRDHVSYFDNLHHAIPQIWRELSAALHLNAFAPADEIRLAALQLQHSRHTLVRSFAFWITWTTGLLGIALFQRPLYRTGEWLMTQLDQNHFSAVSSVLTLVGRFLESACFCRFDRPGAAALGGFVGLAGALAWWAAFDATWRACSASRFRSASKSKSDLPGGLAHDSLQWLFGAVSVFPIFVIYGVWTGWLSAESTGELFRLMVGGTMLLLATANNLLPPWIIQILDSDSEDLPGLALGVMLMIGAAAFTASLGASALPPVSNPAIRYWPAALGDVGWVLAVMWRRSELNLRFPKAAAYAFGPFAITAAVAATPWFHVGFSRFVELCTLLWVVAADLLLVDLVPARKKD